MSKDASPNTFDYEDESSSPSSETINPFSATAPPRAYAKIQFPKFVVYLTQLTASIGRCTGVESSEPFELRKPGGAEDVSKFADLQVGRGDSSISRVHCRITYSPLSQYFEMKIEGKNGCFVNGQFFSKDSRPLRLRSQSSVVFGRTPVKFTFLLPPSDEGSLRQVLNTESAGEGRGYRASANKRVAKESAMIGRPLLIDAVGESLVSSPTGMLTIPDLADAVEKNHPYFKRSFGGRKDIMTKSVRHVLQMNPFFRVVPAQAPGGIAKWAVMTDHLQSFSKPTKKYVKAT